MNFLQQTDFDNKSIAKLKNNLKIRIVWAPWPEVGLGSFGIHIFRRGLLCDIMAALNQSAPASISMQRYPRKEEEHATRSFSTVKTFRQKYSWKKFCEKKIFVKKFHEKKFVKQIREKNFVKKIRQTNLKYWRKLNCFKTLAKIKLL